MTTTQSIATTTPGTPTSRALPTDRQGRDGHVSSMLTRLLSRVLALVSRPAARIWSGTGEQPPARHRAQTLVSPESRDQLATCLHDLVDRSDRPAWGLSTRVPVCRDRIIAADREVRELAAALTGPTAPAVRGVAMASVLLTDGVGPLYNRRAGNDLGAALRAATSAKPSPVSAAASADLSAAGVAMTTRGADNSRRWWSQTDSNCRHPRCKRGALAN